MGKDVEVSGSLTIKDGSKITIKEDSKIEIKPESAITVKGDEGHPFFIKKIAPIAAHIKEVNHIDPITVESLDVSRVRNIDPLRIEKFHVTNLPSINLSLRRLPPVELNIRRLPALSVGVHQVFELPSHYTLRAQLLGIEFLRIQLSGVTHLGPREIFRREQELVPSRSFPVSATAGNPAIPSVHLDKGAHVAPGISCGAPAARVHVCGAAPAGTNPSTKSGA